MIVQGRQSKERNGQTVKVGEGKLGKGRNEREKDETVKNER